MTTSPSGEHAYVHGTSEREQARLGLMNDLVNPPALREMGLRPGDRVLDLGCGLAQLARAMAGVVGPRGRVVGVERSDAQRAKARALAAAAGESDLIDLRAGDAADPPLAADERASFDVVHCRFLLEHVREPLAVVRAMVDAARPGGRIVLQDDDHDVLRVWPEPAGLLDLWRAYIATYAAAEGDAFVGRRLVSLLHGAGARPLRATWLFYGACAGEPALPRLVENLVEVLDGVRDTVIEASRPGAAPWTDAAIDDVLDATRAWSTSPDATLWYGICYAEGRRPATTPAKTGP